MKTTFACFLLCFSLFSSLLASDFSLKFRNDTIDLSYSSHEIFSLKRKSINHARPYESLTLRDYYVYNGFMYLVSHSDGLFIYNVSNPYSPQLLGNIPSANYSFSVTANENLAFVGDGHITNLQIVNTSDPSNPSVLSVYDDLANHDDMAINGNILYSGGGYTVDIINVNNPQNPIRIEQYVSPYAKSLGKLFFSNEFLYFGNSDEGIDIINVSNPATPFFRSRFAEQSQVGFIDDFFVLNNIACVVNDQGGELFIFNVSDSTSPILLSTWYQDDFFKDVIMLNDTVYVLGRNQIYCVDISNPSYPIHFGNYLYLDQSYDFYFMDGFFYLFDYNGLSDLVDMNNIITIPTTASTPPTSNGPSANQQRIIIISASLSSIAFSGILVAVLMVKRKDSIGTKLKPKDKDVPSKAFCNKCGNAITSDDNFCSSCGEMITN